MFFQDILKLTPRKSNLLLNRYQISVLFWDYAFHEAIRFELDSRQNQKSQKSRKKKFLPVWEEFKFSKWWTYIISFWPVKRVCFGRGNRGKHFNSEVKQITLWTNLRLNLQFKGENNIFENLGGVCPKFHKRPKSRIWRGQVVKISQK